MIKTRAKFVVNSVEQTLGHVRNLENGEVESQIVHTVKMSPVYHNDDPEHENSKFWAYTPSGSLELGVINAKAVEGMLPGVEVYVDLTIAN